MTDVVAAIVLQFATEDVSAKRQYTKGNLAGSAINRIPASTEEF